MTDITALLIRAATAVAANKMAEISYNHARLIGEILSDLREIENALAAMEAHDTGAYAVRRLVMRVAEKLQEKREVRHDT